MNAPLQVLARPFAVEPVTKIMMPDGIFDNAIHNLRIAAHLTNTSASALTNVTVYLESVGDPGIALVSRTHFFSSIPAGAAVLIMWDANFQNASPGKKLISFVAQADGFTSRRSIQQIFVSETRFNSATNSYTCTVEEGTLHVSNIKGHTAGKGWGGSGRGDKDCDCSRSFGPVVPTEMTLFWAPNPAFEGVHGELPFADPWWKILAVIVAAVAALVGVIAAALGSGAANFEVGGKVEETDPSVKCCTSEGEPKSGEAEFTVAGVASSIASGALVVACSDLADPFWRGQEATPPAKGELTQGERVIAKWTLAEAPNAGISYATEVSWSYERLTTGNNYQYSVSETQTNIHVAGQVEVEAPDVVKQFDPLWVRAIINKQGGGRFRGAELYAFAVFKSPTGFTFVEPLTDDGLGFDPGANDGVYAAKLDLLRAYRLLLSKHEGVHGVWRVFIYAQDVNLTKSGTAPEIAAQHIGGFFVASAIALTFDASLPCPLKAQANIQVV